MNTEERIAIEGRTLLLFDGLCGMCNRIVRFVMRRDPSRRVLYAPLESRLGREMLADAILRQPSDSRNSLQQPSDGVVLIEAALTPIQKVSVRSDAAARTLFLLNGGWPLAGRLLTAIPHRLREWAYAWIARWRYKVFGAYDVCPLPTAEERKLILGTEA